MNKIRKTGWVKKQTGRYLKEWRFRYALIEGHYLKSYKKANCKEETECVDLTQVEVSYNISNAKQFKLKSKQSIFGKKSEFIFLCTNDSDANQWIKEIYCVQLEVGQEKEKRNIEPSDSYNINLESLSDLDREQLRNDVDEEETASINRIFDISVSLPVIDDIIEPQNDNEDFKEIINDTIYTNEKDILCKLDIMRMLIHDKHNKSNNEHLLNALKVLINDCYISRYNMNPYGSIRGDWHLLKLNHHQTVMTKYMQNEGTSIIKIVHYVLLNSLLAIYKYCDQMKRLKATQILRKYAKFQHGDEKIFRSLMEESFVNKQYVRFCAQALVLCKRLKKHKLCLFPSSIEGFDDDNIFNEHMNWDAMIMDNININKYTQKHKYYCCFPAICTQEIDTKAQNEDMLKFLLTKVYVAK